jgi:hypothetical protein
MCDDHPDRPATHRVQGETDSMGCEMIDMCDDCYSEYKKHADEPIVGCCDWCKAPNVRVREHRDYEEGTHGPVYDVCDVCIKKEAKQLADELNEIDNGLPMYDDGQDDGDDDAPEWNGPIIDGDQGLINEVANNVKNESSDPKRIPLSAWPFPVK